VGEIAPKTVAPKNPRFAQHQKPNRIENGNQTTFMATAGRVFWLLVMRQKCICGRGSAPEPRWGSFYTDPQAGWWRLATLTKNPSPLLAFDLELRLFGRQECPPRKIPGYAYAQNVVYTYLLSFLVNLDRSKNRTKNIVSPRSKSLKVSN